MKIRFASEAPLKVCYGLSPELLTIPACAIVMQHKTHRPVQFEIGLDAAAYTTHSLPRTKASLIYRRTKNPRAVQLLLGHTKQQITVRYIGIDVADALELAEQTDV